MPDLTATLSDFQVLPEAAPLLLDHFRVRAYADHIKTNGQHIHRRNIMVRSHTVAMKLAVFSSGLSDYLVVLKQG